VSRKTKKITGGLCLSLSQGDSLLVEFPNGDFGAVSMIGGDGQRVRLRLAFPKNIPIVRESILDDRQKAVLNELLGRDVVGV